MAQYFIINSWVKISHFCLKIHILLSHEFLVVWFTCICVFPDLISFVSFFFHTLFDPWLDISYSKIYRTSSSNFSWKISDLSSHVNLSVFILHFHRFFVRSKRLSLFVPSCGNFSVHFIFPMYFYVALPRTFSLKIFIFITHEPRKL